MLDVLLRYVIPAAYSLLPDKMASERATAILLAITLQESLAKHRQQFGAGPANGLWMFEPAGLIGVLRHRATAEIIARAANQLKYPSNATVGDLHDAIKHNDILAACFARCLLWTDPRPLPFESEPEFGWSVYVETWRPGRPRLETWRDNYTSAWNLARVTPALRA